MNCMSKVVSKYRLKYSPKFKLLDWPVFSLPRKFRMTLHGSAASSARYV